MTEHDREIWEGAPQCPECDGPLAYYTDDGHSTPDGWHDPDGSIECCTCAWEEYVTGTSESDVLDRLFIHVRRCRVPRYAVQDYDYE